MFDFEKLSTARFYIAPTVEKIIEFSPPNIDVENISKVLSLSAVAKCDEAIPYNGYSDLKGRANFRLIYIDRENIARGVDYNADFTAHVDGDFEEGDNLVCTVNVAEAEVGANDYLTLTAALELAVSATRRENIDLLTVAEDCYKKTRGMTLPSFVASKTSTAEFFDDANVGGEIDSVLSINSNVAVKSAQATDGGAVVKSVVYVTVTYLKDGAIEQQTFEIPLEDEINLDGVLPTDALKVDAMIRGAKVILQGVTGDNVLRVEGDVVYNIHAYRCQKVDVVDDMFLLSNELEITRARYQGRCYLGGDYTEEAVSGIALLGDNRPNALQVVTLPYARCYTLKTYTNDDGNIVAEGVVNTDIVYTDENGYNSVRTEIPFSIVLDKAEDGVSYKANCVCVGISAKVRKDREFEIDTTLAVTLEKYADIETEYIASVELGAERKKNTSPVSLYIAENGEDMLDVCKSLYAMPDDIMAQNPTLEFPLKEGEQVLYFRQLK